MGGRKKHGQVVIETSLATLGHQLEMCGVLGAKLVDQSHTCSILEGSGVICVDRGRVPGP